MLCYTEQKNISCYSSLDHPGTPIQQLTVLQKMRKIVQWKYVVTSSCCLFLLRYIRLNAKFFAICLMKCEIWKHFESLYECKNRYLEILCLRAKQTKKIAIFFLNLEHTVQAAEASALLKGLLVRVLFQCIRWFITLLRPFSLKQN